MIHNPFDTPLYIKSMKATVKYDGGVFGAVNTDVGMTIGAKDTVLSPQVEMISEAGLPFLLKTILPFVLKNPGLIKGSSDISFVIESTIVAVVGGADGYLGNVQYNQQADITVNLKFSLTDLLKLQTLQGTGHADATTTEAPAAPTATITSETPATTEAPQNPTTSAQETTTTVAPTVAKRQDIAAPFGDLDNMLAQLKTLFNQHYAEIGEPAPFA
jgi:hypothetical protein